MKKGNSYMYRFLKRSDSRISRPTTGDASHSRVLREIPPVTDERARLLPSPTNATPGTQETGYGEYWQACYAGFEKCFGNLSSCMRGATTQDTSASATQSAPGDTISAQPSSPPVLRHPLHNSEQTSRQDSPQRNGERQEGSPSRASLRSLGAGPPQGLRAGETGYPVGPTTEESQIMDEKRKNLLDSTKGMPMDEQFPKHQNWLRDVPSTYRVEQATKIYNSLVGKQSDLALDYIGDYMMSAYHMNRIESIIISKGLNIKVPNQNTQEWENFANEIYVKKEEQIENEFTLIMVGDILGGGTSRKLSEDDRNSAEYINQMTDILTQWNEKR
jgi:hypothetical protein